MTTSDSSATRTHLRSVAIVWLSTLLGWVVNYLYHPLMIRGLDLGTFAIFEGIVSILNILGVLTTWFVLYLTKEVSLHLQNTGYIKTLWVYTNQLLLRSACAVYLIFIACSPLLAWYLHMESSRPLIFTWSVIIFTFLTTFPTAVLQGKGNFSFLAFVNIASSILKLGIWLLSVRVWRGLYGWIWGFIASTLAVYILSRRKVSSYFSSQIVPTQSLESQHALYKIKDTDKKSLVQFFFLVFFLAARTNLDILIVNNLFQGNDMSGIYAGLSVLAKCVIFFGTAIETVYYPQIMQYTWHKKAISSLNIACLLITWLGLFSLIWAYLLGPRALNLFKAGFWIYINYFLRLILFCWLYAYISMFGKVLIGWKDTRTNRIIWIWVITMISAWSIRGKLDIQYYIRVLCISAWLTALALFIRLLAVKRHVQSHSEDYTDIYVQTQSHTEAL